MSIRYRNIVINGHSENLAMTFSCSLRGSDIHLKIAKIYFSAKIDKHQDCTKN